MDLQKIKDEPNKGQWGVVDKLYSTAPTLILAELESEGIRGSVPKITHAGNATYYGRQAYKVSFSLHWEGWVYVDRKLFIYDGLNPEHSARQILSEFKHIQRAADKQVVVCVLPFITIRALSKFCLNRNLDISPAIGDRLPVLQVYRQHLK